MWKITDSLEILSSLLNYLQSYCLFSSHLLLAGDDQNQEDCVTVFWKVLHNLLCSTDCNDIVDCTKLNFAERGYKGLYFYILPSDFTQGSRELLLAFSWLISKQIIEEKIDKLVSEVVNINSLPSPKQPSSLSDNTRTVDVNNEFNYILHQSGIFRHAHYSYIINSNNRSALLTQVKGKGTENIECINLLEAHYNNNLPNNVKSFPALINLFLSWKSQEKYYFQWVKTVLNKKLFEDKRIIDEDGIHNAEAIKLLFRKEVTKQICVKEIKFQQILKTECKAKDHLWNLQPYIDKVQEINNSFDLSIS